MRITGFESNAEIMREIGQRIRDTRIAMPLTRAELACKAGVAERTLATIEQGGGATLDKLISVLRALGLTANLDGLVTEQGTRPSDLSSLGGKRQRATSATRGRQHRPGGWKWGDER